MQTTRDLFHAFLDLGGQRPDVTQTLFADDGVYEAPYLESLGLPWRYQGRREIEQHFEQRRDLFPGLLFHHRLIVADGGDCVVAEYQFTTRSSKTGRMVHQLIVGRLESAGGQITLLRETLNLVEMALALYRRGLADYQIPRDRDFWRDP